MQDLGILELIIIFLIAIVFIGGRKVGIFSDKRKKKASKKVKGKSKKKKK